MRFPRLGLSLFILALLGASAGLAQRGELQVEIHSPPSELLLTNSENDIDVEGRASIFGGIRQLDLFLVLDASNSLHRTDPKDFRTKAAIELARSLPERSDIFLGLIDFNYKARLIADLTADRESVARELDDVVREGGTNLADGILKAIDGFNRKSRPDAARIVLLFTDGKSDAKKALAAAQTARDNNVVIHTILLTDRKKSEKLLREIADTTGGTYVYTENPEELPRAFLELKTTGVDHVMLDVNGSAAIGTSLVAGTFSGNVPLREGRNRITATATDLDGNTARDAAVVTVTGPLRVAIAKPIDGALFERVTAETDVAINASVFTELSDALRSEFPREGISQVMLSAGGSPPVATEYVGGQWLGRVPLSLQGNRITATATSFDGRIGQAFVDVTMRPPGCGGLQVFAERDGRPAISLDDRGLEIIFDASNSMWGRMDGQPKITIAKNTLRQVMTGFPQDFFVALRVYGHQHDRKLKNCTDSALLMPLGLGNADVIRRTIERFQPKGMTPLAYSIERTVEDFGEFEGDRAVVLVTDGIESCDGDPVGAAQHVQRAGSMPIHVIGFALSDSPDVAVAGLRAIATTSGGRFYLAGSGDELRRALMETAGTPYSIWKDGRRVDGGVLGVTRKFQLKGGDYLLRLEGGTPREFPFTLRDEEELSFTLSKTGSQIRPRELRHPIPYVVCD